MGEGLAVLSTQFLCWNFKIPVIGKREDREGFAFGCSCYGGPLPAMSVVQLKSVKPLTFAETERTRRA